MPLVSSTFKGNSISRNGHAETILPGIFRKLQVTWQRETLNLPDTDFIHLDFLRNEHPRLLLLMHGLEGSSNSQYIKGMARYFSEREFDICAFNFRSCSGMPNKLLRSYHSGATEDLHEVIQYVTAQNKYAEIYLCGFSLGGNMLLKYLGEQKYPIPKLVKAAAAFSVPIDLAKGAERMEHWDNIPYMQMFLRSLNKKLLYKARVFKGAIQTDGLHKIKTFHEWDNRFTAPLHGFESSAEYYAKCSSKQFLKQIEVKTLLLNAQNDPFLSAACFPEEYEISENVWFEKAKYGGHCGFAYGLPNGSYFSEERLFQFFSNKQAILYV